MDPNSSDENPSYMVRTLNAILSSFTDAITRQAQEFFQRLLLVDVVFLYGIFVESVFLMIECIGYLFRNGIQTLVNSSPGEPFWTTMQQAARSGGILMWNIFQGFLQIVKNFSKNPEEFLESESECEPNGGR